MVLRPRALPLMNEIDEKEWVNEEEWWRLKNVNQNNYRPSSQTVPSTLLRFPHISIYIAATYRTQTSNDGLISFTNLWTNTKLRAIDYFLLCLRPSYAKPSVSYTLLFKSNLIRAANIIISPSHKKLSRWLINARCTKNSGVCHFIAAFWVSVNAEIIHAVLLKWNAET